MKISGSRLTELADSLLPPALRSTRRASGGRQPYKPMTARKRGSTLAAMAIRMGFYRSGNLNEELRLHEQRQR